MRKPNRLINENSPYLLQHAYNPIDWYPWCEEAFEKAKNENKPIFLSIGYSTCHWCHVMEKESFEDEEVAQILNENFISIKVDREERPDIDLAYMTICQAMTGHGGWPLTIIMTPDKKPFFAGTYIPKHSRYGRIGLIELLQRVVEIWKENRDKIESLAEQITGEIKEAVERVEIGNGIIDETTLTLAFKELEENFDPEYGGFGDAPKFPTPHNLMFLLRYWKRTGNKKALEMVEKTLIGMSLGGIYDHIGFGFHRYSTDRKWLVPHFEKMLYDQALISLTCAETYQATQKEKYATLCSEVFSYVINNLTNPEGGFFSAEDADSEGEEGKFYLWELDELEKILNQNELKFLIENFNIKKDGNYIDELKHSRTGKNIFHLTSELDDEKRKIWEKIRVKLLQHRDKRIHPLKDDKILTDWNGLMISSLARGYSIFGKDDYIRIAEKSINFIFKNMVTSDGKLLHRFRSGEARINGHLDDYAFLTWGLIELYEATFKTEYLKNAIELTYKMIELFWDENNGGFFLSENDDVIFKQKEIYDGALPSGNSVALLALVKLSKITGRNDLNEIAYKLVETFSGTIIKHPSAYTFFLSAFDFLLGPSFEIIIVGKSTDNLSKILQPINSKFIPNKILLFKPTDREDEINSIAPFLSHYKAIDGKTTFYICTNYECKQPATSVEEMMQLIDEVIS